MAGLPFVYVGSFVCFLHAYPLLGPTTCKSIEPFYWPLIWLGFRIEWLLRWMLGA